MAYEWLTSGKWGVAKWSSIWSRKWVVYKGFYVFQTTFFLP